MATRIGWDSGCLLYTSIGRFGIKMDYRHQAEMYRSGKYAQQVLHALKHRAEIFEILDSHRTQEATDEERKNFYPVSIYCPVCGKDTTKITSLSEDCTVAEYRCSCGQMCIRDSLIPMRRSLTKRRSRSCSSCWRGEAATAKRRPIHICSPAWCFAGIAAGR